MLALALLLIAFGTGCGLGNSPGPWKSGLFSSDGKYYVYVYSEIFTTSISKRGGSTTSQGILSFHVQALECATGKKLYPKPIKLEGSPVLMDVRGDRVWLNCYEQGKQPQYGPALFSLQKGKMVLGQEELRKLNPAVSLSNVQSYFAAPAGSDGIALEADDARRYLIDPVTGHCTLAPDTLVRLSRGDGACYQTTTRSDEFSEQGSNRRYYVKRDGARSTDDFISPEMVSLNRLGVFLEQPPTLFLNGPLVLSPLNTGLKKDMQLTLLNGTDLTTRWSMALPQNEQPANNYGMERFAVNGDRLYVANASHFIAIDVPSGNVLLNVPLQEE